MLRIRNIGNAHAVDWFRVLADLTRHGVSDLAVSKAIDVPPRTIGGWKNEGAQPRHSDGEALIDLRAKVTGCDRAACPRPASYGRAPGYRQG